jgi:RES domain-containing protein
VPSPELVAAIDQLEPAAYSGHAFRHQAAQYNPLSGAGARSLGGRWNPPESFATLYLAVERETAVAEFNRMAARSNRTPQDFLPRRLYRYELSLAALVDLRHPDAREAVELRDADLLADDPTSCQAGRAPDQPWGSTRASLRGRGPQPAATRHQARHVNYALHDHRIADLLAAVRHHHEHVYPPPAPPAGAGALGFAGNWVAALIRTRAGRQIDSPALVADGDHARADAYVSLAVVASAATLAAGLDIADPLIGLAITLVILNITWRSWRTVSGHDRTAAEPR